jgi:hypothetical protein
MTMPTARYRGPPARELARAKVQQRLMKLPVSSQIGKSAHRLTTNDRVMTRLAELQVGLLAEPSSRLKA